MNLTRRTLLGALASVASLDLKAIGNESAHAAGFSAVLFDGLAIFDPRPVFALAAKLFGPEAGPKVVEGWRSRLFQYQWLRALSNSYVDFEHAAADALVFAARQAHVPLPNETREQLLHAFHELMPWPDVAEGLAALKRTIPRVGFLSNMTRAMLDDSARHAGLAGAFDPILSTDAVKSFKPAPRAYALGIDTLHVRREKVLFVAFAGWDAAGARQFGYPTFWLNRLGAEAEELSAGADATGREMRDVIEFVKQHG